MNHYLSRKFRQIFCLLFYLSFSFSLLAEEESKLLFSFGVMSDLHSQQTLISGATEDVRLRGTVTDVLTAIKQQESLDMLVLNGDFTSDVTISESNWEKVRDLMIEATRASFPTSTSTPVLYVAGNHEYEVANFDNLPKPYNAANFYDKPMKTDVGVLSSSECFYENADNGTSDPQSLLAAYHYVIKGFDCVALNCGKFFFQSAWNYQYSIESVQWVADKLQEIYASDPDKTVFFFAHVPFSDSKSISNSNKGLLDCQSTTLLKKTLAKYPNLIFIYGHDHGSDNAYIRTQTAQRVTQYDTNGNLYTPSSTNGNESESTDFYVINDKTNEYLGRTASDDDNMHTFADAKAMTINETTTSGIYNLLMDCTRDDKNVYCGTAGGFSGNSLATNIWLYKVTSEEGGTVVASQLYGAVVPGEKYLIVGIKNNAYYALSNQSNGSTGNDLRMVGKSVTIADATITYTDDDTTDDYSVVWKIDNKKSTSTETVTPSFISTFDGSMRYYNNSIDAGSSVNNSSITQALIVYVYNDKVVLQMKNYAQTGTINGITIQETPEPYTITRKVTNSEKNDPEISYPQINHTFTKTDQQNRFIDRATYTTTGDPVEIFNLNLGKSELSAFPSNMNIISGDNAIISYLTPALEINEGDQSFVLTCYSTHYLITVDGVTYKNNMTWTNQKIFVDWNQDGDFKDENEEYDLTDIESSSSSANPPTHPFRLDQGYARTITVPTGVQAGTYRMWVAYGEERTDWTWDQLFTTNTLSQGNIFEFNIHVNETQATSFNVTLPTSINNGSLTVLNGTTPLQAGLNVVDKEVELSFEVAPDAGYKLESFQVNGVEHDPETPIILTTDLTISVSFMEDVPILSKGIHVPTSTYWDKYQFRFDDEVLGPHTNKVNNDYTNGVVVNNGDNRARNFTVSTWIKPLSTGSLFGHVQAGYFGTDGSFSAYLNENNKLVLKARAWKTGSACPGIKDIVTDESLALNEWAFLTIVVNDDEKTISLYKNGKLIGTGDTSSVIEDNNTVETHGIGLLSDECVFFAGNGGSYMDLDEFQLWNKSLTAKEIKKSMRGFTSIPSDLLAYYTFDENSGSEIANKGTGAQIAAALNKGYETNHYWYSDYTCSPIQATFVDSHVLPKFTITYQQPENGGSLVVKDEDDHIIESGSLLSQYTTLSIEATPASGYVLKGLSVNNVELQETSFELDQDITIEVSFTNNLVFTKNTPEGADLTVTTNKDGQTITLNNDEEFDHDADLTVQVTPNIGYEVASLLINEVERKADLNNGELTLSNCQENVSIQLEMVKLKYELTFETPSANLGTLTVKLGTQSLTSGTMVEYGSVLTVNVVPTQIAELTSLLINDVERKNDLVNNALNLNVEEAITIKTVLEAPSYSFTWATTGNGSVEVLTDDNDMNTVTSGNTWIKGSSFIITMTPDDKESIISLENNQTNIPLVNGDLLDVNLDGSAIYFLMLNEDTNLDIEFSAITSLKETQIEGAYFDQKTKTLTIPLQTIATVYNANGHQVLTTSDTKTSFIGLSEGCYFVKLIQNQKVSTLKVMLK